MKKCIRTATTVLMMTFLFSFHATQAQTKTGAVSPKEDSLLLAVTTWVYRLSELPPGWSKAELPGHCPVFRKSELALERCIVPKQVVTVTLLNAVYRATGEEQLAPVIVISLYWDSSQSRWLPNGGVSITTLAHRKEQIVKALVVEGSLAPSGSHK